MALILDGTEGITQPSITTAFGIPVGTTGERPASPANGAIRMNTTTTEPEWYDEVGDEWLSFSTEPNRTFSADFLVVAGGGSGGNGNASIRIYGGGGAGGYRTSAGTSGGNSAAETALSLAPATNYTVTVGAGAAGQAVANSYGNQGSNSVFATITSTGGGGGAPPAATGNGGSGGGGGMDGSVYSPGNGTANQGSTGGTGDGSTGGGGGGAGAVGGNGAGGTGAVGGAGIASSITGSSVTRAGGGGGGGTSSGGAGGAGGGTAGNSSTAADANTGGGSGGTATAIGTGNGGSGVVIVKYPDTLTITNPGGGLTSSTASAGGFKVTTFTAGTGTIQFN